MGETTEIAGRVDTHHHVVPPHYRQWLIERGLHTARPVPWSLGDTLRKLDEFAIRTAVLSTPTLGRWPAEHELAPQARRINEFTAEIVRDRPDRFGFFANLPLPDVAGTLAEIEVAYDEFGADGVLVPTNAYGRYLGDPDFEEVFAELDRRAAVVFTHPTAVGVPPAPGIPSYVADYLLDTVRTAIDLVRTGRTERFPNLKIILSHGGGFLPFAAHRLATAPGTWGDLTTAEVVARLRGFYFDTALTSSPVSLPSLLAFAEPGHVLFGTDWPFADQEIPYYTGFLDAHPMSDVDRAGIEHGNAEALLPRLQTTAAWGYRASRVAPGS
ncbi:amidohydrolase family protein [Saccharopolyspora phatthalungensis]|uniref:Putative TIM-barrel fold metal-dependent hydrolase n=1 Tax=Saccharopolyspora phatthalungensis TaxID=664693 RepID=A0A840QH88_9PSEU|nr:amidohydrolase family protein [Saccharopolyspora phatthalungensis]MBB5158009.1 putative TIM-barrel fold metal-dependent hydrolase [Saccharopolyspora phatthalungensis]